MLRKLLKQEFMATARLMLPLYLAVILLGLGAKLAALVLNYSSDTSGGVFSGVGMPGQIGNFLDVLMVLLVMGFVIALIAAFVVAFVLMITRFRNNLLGDEGYVMFTLPVSAHQLVWSKLLVALVWFAGAIVVDGIAILLVVMGDELTFSQLFPAISSFFSQFTTAQAAHFVGYTVEGLLLAAVLTFSCCLEFYAAMSIGHSFAKHKGLLSVVFFFAISAASEVISSVLMLGADKLGLSIQFSSFSQLAALLVINLIFAGVLYFLTTYMLKNRLNLE